MEQTPPTPQWQFPLRLLFFATAMFSVGMAMIVFTKNTLSSMGADFFYPDSEDTFLRALARVPMILGWFLVTAAPGMVIGYGFARRKGAIYGAVISIVVGINMFCAVTFIFFPWMWGRG